VIFEIEIGDGPLTFDLYIDVKKFRGGWWWWVELDYNVSSGPFLSFEIEIGDGPGPELDNIVNYLLQVRHANFAAHIYSFLRQLY